MREVCDTNSGFRRLLCSSESIVKRRCGPEKKEVGVGAKVKVCKRTTQKGTCNQRGFQILQQSSRLAQKSICSKLHGLECYPTCRDNGF